jgi:DNA segregation ATPase FtsK/SpoIIIE, S-DNA-T family
LYHINLYLMFKIPKFLPELEASTKITIAIVGSLAAGILTYLSIFGLAGRFGGLIGSILQIIFGRGSVVIPAAFFLTAVFLLRYQKNPELRSDANGRLLLGLGCFLLSFSGFLSLFFGVTNLGNSEQGGGLLGYFIYPFILQYIGAIGAFVVLSAIAMVGFFLISQMTFYQFVQNLKEVARNPAEIWDLIPDIFELWKGSKESKATADGQLNEEDGHPPESMDTSKNSSSAAKTQTTVAEPKVVDVQAIPVSQKQTTPKPSFSFTSSQGEVLEMRPSDSPMDWKLPPFDILKENKTKVEAGDIEGNKKVIKDTLAHFGITVDMGDTRVGPTVTQYTLKPANGVKLSAIDNLQRDLALALAASNIRIEAPISGQSLVGIEIPNTIKSQVRLRDIIQTHKFIHFDGELAVAVGQDVAGQNLVYSLSKMPHLLVAGATGSGKSVWINGMLLSLLYRYSPQEMQLVLVDMKRVELKLYDSVPHLLAPVITDAEKAINALKWTVLEMDRRYKLLEEQGKRNIKDYNKSATSNKIEALPYVVFVIDELGDLMMLAKAEVEPIVVRLTQMSRAVGIHLVLGTQRPDTHVVTGLIKANVPSRIAFAVASQIDSRVILDQAGAEKLLGQGDGLFMSPSSMYAVRFQGPNVDENEVRKCVEFLKRQAQENHNYNNLNPVITQTPKVKVNVPGMATKDDSETDDVFEEAKRLVIQYQKASASFLQQMMGIGYPKAARIIQQLEETGVIGPQNGSKPRDVYGLAEE